VRLKSTDLFGVFPGNLLHILSTHTQTGMDGLGIKFPPSLGHLFKPAEFLHLLEYEHGWVQYECMLQVKLIKSVKS